MTKSILAFSAAALLALPTVAFADEAAKDSFTYQGVDYSYTTKTEGNVLVLHGASDKGRVPFVLRISKTAVTGTFGSEAVSFPVSEVRHLERTTLASR